MNMIFLYRSKIMIKSILLLIFSLLWVFSYSILETQVNNEQDAEQKIYDNDFKILKLSTPLSFQEQKPQQIKIPIDREERAELLVIFIRWVFRLLFSIAGIIAVLGLVIGGFKITLSSAQGQVSGLSEAKKYFTNSLIGLALLFSSYIVLNTINPKLLDFSINEKPVAFEKKLPKSFSTDDKLIPTGPTGNIITNGGNEIKNNGCAIHNEKMLEEFYNVIDELLEIHKNNVNEERVDDLCNCSKLKIRITGGDRYKDEEGVIRSLSNGKPISGSVGRSRHLFREGARAIDFTITGRETSENRSCSAAKYDVRECKNLKAALEGARGNSGHIERIDYNYSDNHIHFTFDETFKLNTENKKPTIGKNANACS